jgi:quercetin dioxygenase-like cupin family protein
MERWDLAAPNDSGRDGPRVLFSTPEARGVVIDLAAGEALGDHQVRERAILHVLEGTVACATEAGTTECGRGTLVVFEPSEPHAVRAVAPARLLLVLTPWPAAGHYPVPEHDDPHALPVNATERPRSGP